ncbi:MAG: phosphohistidine phosphatase SixA [Anaerolineae bacterium]
MDLYLLRHAIAVERGTPGYEIDATRPLTPEGARKMHRIAEGMTHLDIDPDVIITSPYLRARQTAEIVAEMFRLHQSVEIHDALSPGGDQARLLDDLSRRYGDHKSVILVGHEPDLSEIASTLMAGSLDASLDMRKGGLCLLTAPSLHYGQCATLKWLLTPKQLTLLA